MRFLFFPPTCSAVSELAEALRDSDDVKKQRNEAAKENKDLRRDKIKLPITYKS